MTSTDMDATGRPVISDDQLAVESGSMPVSLQAEFDALERASDEDYITFALTEGL